jgi:hypothetical protein
MMDQLIPGIAPETQPGLESNRSPALSHAFAKYPVRSYNDQPPSGDGVDVCRLAYEAVSYSRAPYPRIPSPSWHFSRLTMKQVKDADAGFLYDGRPNGNRGMVP